MTTKYVILPSISKDRRCHQSSAPSYITEKRQIRVLDNGHHERLPTHRAPGDPRDAEEERCMYNESSPTSSLCPAFPPIDSAKLLCDKLQTCYPLVNSSSSIDSESYDHKLDITHSKAAQKMKLSATHPDTSIVPPSGASVTPSPRGRRRWYHPPKRDSMKSVLLKNDKHFKEADSNLDNIKNVKTPDKANKLVQEVVKGKTFVIERESGPTQVANGFAMWIPFHAEPGNKT